MTDPQREADDLTEALVALRNGREGAWNDVFDRVYEELRKVARGQLRRLRPGATLDTTGLVHEAYLKFVDQSRIEVNDRSHFYAVAARAMRQVLVDYARRARRAKRGDGLAPLELDEGLVAHREDFERVVAIDDALCKLAAHSERQARIVEYRYFVGLTEEEIAGLESVTSRTVRNEWTRARAWLIRAMRSG